jgi:phosphate transport system substrate-binding protein
MTSFSRSHRKAPTVRRQPTRSTVLFTSMACLLLLFVATAPASGGVAHARIEGSGSSWAANAVNQWIADVTSSGLQVVFTSQGSAQGRKDFANNTTDFGISDIGFLGVDPATGAQDTSQGRAYAYLPIVAGGTSFPYNITVGGRQVRDLRLSGQTLAKIFTNKIKTWNDPAITADNNGRKLPGIAIVPLVHSEGSGSTAQLTTYFNSVYPGIWRPYYGKSGFTEYYPKSGNNMIAQNGSDQIINYATSGAANGVITYDEYSYALAKNFPVVKVENASGYFTLPTQYNVAVALQKAQINNDKTSPNYLLQDLTQVYGYSDNRTYPLSSYSYMIIPTGAADPRMSTAKRQTLVDYLYYSVCQGQQEMGPIGYSPLPINLVQASFAQTNKLKAADGAVDVTSRDVSTCHNPTFVAGQPTRNYLAEIAPQPPACDRAGAGPCTGGAASSINGNPQDGRAPSAATGTGAGTAAGGGTGAAAGGGSSGSPGGASGSTGLSGTALGGAAKAGSKIDPVTGQVLASGGAQSGVNADQLGVPTDVSANSALSNAALGTLCAVLLLLAIAMPPVIARAASRRTKGR